MTRYLILSIFSSAIHTSKWELNILFVYKPVRPFILVHDSDTNQENTSFLNLIAALVRSNDGAVTFIFTLPVPRPAELQQTLPIFKYIAERKTCYRFVRSS